MLTKMFCEGTNDFIRERRHNLWEINELMLR